VSLHKFVTLRNLLGKLEENLKIKKILSFWSSFLPLSFVMHDSQLSLEELVKNIKAVNQVWKDVRRLFGEQSPLASEAKALKNCLQVRLLRKFAPDQVYLKIDPETGEEPLYGLRLCNCVSGYEDADHLPVRVASEIFTEAELQSFVRTTGG
jgi:hypothetical protein